MPVGDLAGFVPVAVGEVPEVMSGWVAVSGTRGVREAVEDKTDVLDETPLWVIWQSMRGR